jgi:hypothetical protein
MKTPTEIQLDARRDTLTAEHLSAFANDNVGMVRIKNAASLEQCEKLREAAQNPENTHNHAAVPNLKILGQPFYLAATDGKLRQGYYDFANVFAPLIRAMCAPFGSPFDTAVGLLETASEKGIRPASLSDGRHMPPGIFRFYEAAATTEVLPHIDRLEWEVDDPVAHGLRAQFGLNVYLDMPTQGGELAIYPHKLDKDTFNRIAGDGYGLPWDYVGEPDITIRPDIGEAILIDTRRVHAVMASRGAGYRVTLSSFVGLDADGHLMPWA